MSDPKKGTKKKKKVSLKKTFQFSGVLPCCFVNWPPGGNRNPRLLKTADACNGSYLQVASTFLHIFPPRQAQGFLIWCTSVSENNIPPVWETCKQARITAPHRLSVLGINYGVFSQELAREGNEEPTDTTSAFKKKKKKEHDSIDLPNSTRSREAHDEPCRISHSSSRHTWGPSSSFSHLNLTRSFELVLCVNAAFKVVTRGQGRQHLCYSGLNGLTVE